MPKKGSYLCSAHFISEDYRHGKGDRKRLKVDSVPSIFSFPKHLIKKPKFRRTLDYKKDDPFVSKSLPKYNAIFIS